MSVYRAMQRKRVWWSRPLARPVAEGSAEAFCGALLLCGVVVLLCGLSGCMRRPSVVAPPSPLLSGNLPYLYLQPGWRLSIVSPMSTAMGAVGDSKLRLSEASPVSGDVALTLEMKTSDDFSYLRAYVLLRGVGGRGRAGVRFREESAHRHKGEAVTAVALPEALKAMLPRLYGPALVLFLTRAAEVDHDMAILQAKTQAQLAQLTAAVQASPLEACRIANDATCHWVPRGVAVRVEKPVSTSAESKKTAWVPVL